MLKNCERHKIEKMLKLLGPEERKKFEAVMLQQLLCKLEIEKDEITLENLKELDDEQEIIDLRAPAAD